MLERFFFDSSAFIAILRKEPLEPVLSAMIERLNRSQCVTSVLVAYELYRGVPLSNSRRKKQIQDIETMLSKFTLKSVFEAQAMAAAKCHRYSKGAIDPILAAQSIDGGFTMVTVNLQDFERVPGIKIHNF